MIHYSLTGQEKDIPAGTLDSLEQELQMKMDRRIEAFQYTLRDEIRRNTILIDSLSTQIAQQDSVIQLIIMENQKLAGQVAVTREVMQNNRIMLLEEKQKTRNILLIGAPSLLFLLLVSSLLFFLLLLRYQKETDRKIVALKKYTYVEVEDARNDLMKIFKKRVKKIMDSLGSSPQAKPKAKKSKKKKNSN